MATISRAASTIYLSWHNTALTPAFSVICAIHGPIDDIYLYQGFICSFVYSNCFIGPLVMAPEISKINETVGQVRIYADCDRVYELLILSALEETNQQTKGWGHCQMDN